MDASSGGFPSPSDAQPTPYRQSLAYGILEASLRAPGRADLHLFRRAYVPDSQGEKGYLAEPRQPRSHEGASPDQGPPRAGDTPLMKNLLPPFPLMKNLFSGNLPTSFLCISL